MKHLFSLLCGFCFAPFALADGHGPVFGLATPTNSQGEWSFDAGAFGRSERASSPLPTRIQPGADFDAGAGRGMASRSHYVWLGAPFTKFFPAPLNESMPSSVGPRKTCWASVWGPATPPTTNRSKCPPTISANPRQSHL